MRNSACAMENGLEYLFEAIKRVPRLYEGYIHFDAWCTLCTAFKAQKKIYLGLVREANDFRRSNLVWDSGDMVPIGITLKA